MYVIVYICGIIYRKILSYLTTSYGRPRYRTSPDPPGGSRKQRAQHVSAINWQSLVTSWCESNEVWNKIQGVSVKVSDAVLGYKGSWVVINLINLSHILNLFVSRSRTNVGGNPGLNFFQPSEAAPTQSLRLPSTSAAAPLPTIRRPVYNPPSKTRIQFDSVLSKTYTGLEHECDK